MKTVYAVRAIPLRDVDGAVIGWVGVDLVADGTRPSDMVLLADGTACGQVEALVRVARDPGLLYPTEEAAVHEGLTRLREADARRETEGQALRAADQHGRGSIQTTRNS